MKRLTLFFIAPILLILILIDSSLVSAPGGTDGTEDSTPAERIRLSKYLNGEIPPPDMHPKRLHSLLRLLDELSDSQSRIDAGMYVRRPQNFMIADEFVFVKDIRGNEQGAEVTVHVYSLSREEKFRLIRDFEESGAPGFPDIDNPWSLLKTDTRRIEIHGWTKTGGKWKKSEVNTVLLEL